jgi:hypothetical protein
LIPVRASNFYRVRNRNFFLIGGGTSRPRASLFPAVDSEFERAPSRNAAEEFGKFFIILEFQPINQTVSIAVRMNGVQQLLTIELEQLFWREAASKRRGGRRWFCTPEEAEAAGWRRALR